MAKESVTDQLWEFVEPLLPPEEPKPKGGRPCVYYRAALTGSVFEERHPLGDAPQGDGLRVRFDILAEAARLAGGGCVAPVARVLLDRLGEADKIDWSRASLDSASVAAKGGREGRK